MVAQPVYSFGHRFPFGRAFTLIREEPIKGLRARQPRIVVPFRWAPFSWTRGLFNIVTDWHLGRQHEMHKLMRELERGRDRQS
nr:hypothetical protein [Burkholderia ubonensis]